ncbi:MAG TPA: hypothetical protein VLR88_02530, partial [Propionibacteriaceae bacterium]|nr:hypothetical protein [Propionibacteriaceae bacterium]
KAAMEEWGQLISSDQLCSTAAGSRPQGSAMVPYEDDVFIGCRITTSAPLSVVDSSGTNLKLADGVWTFKIGASELEGMGGSGELTSDAFTDFRVSVTFPGEVLTHNGSSNVDRRTVTWASSDDLLSAEGLRATGKDAGTVGGVSTPTALYLGLGVAFVLLAAFVALLVTGARKKNTVQPNAPGYPGQPYPGQPYQGQPYQGQPYPPQTDAGQAYPQPPYQGQSYFGQPNSDQPYPGEPYQGQIYPNGPDPTQPGGGQTRPDAP